MSHSIAQHGMCAAGKKHTPSFESRCAARPAFSSPAQHVNDEVRYAKLVVQFGIICELLRHRCRINDAIHREARGTEPADGCRQRAVVVRERRAQHLPGTFALVEVVIKGHVVPYTDCDYFAGVTMAICDRPLNNKAISPPANLSQRLLPHGSTPAPAQPTRGEAHSHPWRVSVISVDGGD